MCVRNRVTKPLVVLSRMDQYSRVYLSPVNFFLTSRTGYKVGFAKSASGMVMWGTLRVVTEENEVILV